MSEVIITGQGRYLCANGEMCQIGKQDFPGFWRGWLKDGIIGYRADGTVAKDPSDDEHRIIGPWVDPAAEPKPEPDACPDPNLIYPVKLRDWFAGQALAAMGTWCPGNHGDYDYAGKAETRARHAYHQADAMMAARKGGAS